VNAANPTVPPVLDGRTARSARTRDAVVRALLGLISEGDVRPTAGRIAERAGISLRSVYVHFDDLDDLFLAAFQRRAVGHRCVKLRQLYLKLLIDQEEGLQRAAKVAVAGRHDPVDGGFT